MKYFVSGATGFIGHELVKSLLQRGDRVNILVRSKNKIDLPASENLVVFEGDLNDTTVIEKCMTGCNGVFHLAGYAKIWSKNKNLPFDVNVTGTKNILEAALKTRVKKVVFTSSAGTLKPSVTDEAIDETVELPEGYLTDYEKTKFLAEELCHAYNQNGLDVVIVNPSRVYGPGLLGDSNSVTAIIKLYTEGKWHYIPGDGRAIGNYVYINDVVEGHLKAMEAGRKGEKYILGGENASFNQFLDKVATVSGKRNWQLKIPLLPLLLFARISLLAADILGIKPVITPSWIKRYLQNRVLSSNKAAEQLNYTITPLETGISETIKWLSQDRSRVPSDNYFTLITGASSGIGKAIAEECSKRKMNLFLVALPDSGLELIAEELCEKFGIAVHYFGVDLTEKDGPQKVYNYAHTAGITVNILINNAGIGSLGDFENQEYKNIDDIILLNIRATTLLTRLFLNDLMLLPSAYILNMSSFGAFAPVPLKSVYAATKTYLWFFTKSLSVELKETNIKVASMHPSGVATNQRITESMKKTSFSAKLTVLRSEYVAEIAIKNLLKGKNLIIPGIPTKIFFSLGYIMPYFLILYFISKIFSKGKSATVIK